MSNDEKFTVYTRANDWRTAAGNIYHFSNWRSLGGMRRSDNEPQDGAEYRVTVERIEPEPDAEAEKRWWRCSWNPCRGYLAREWSAPGESSASWDKPYKLDHAITYIHSATEPTFAEFAAAVKDVTGVEIPVPEEPTYWERVGGCPWEQSKGASEVVIYPTANGWYTKVFGTRETIDAKRDRLLAAAREAGKP